MTASSSSRSYNAPPSSSSSSQQTSPINARRVPQKTPFYEHHPFRLEVQQVTPVSISMRWSLRPPPISELRLGEGGVEKLFKKSLSLAIRPSGRTGSDEGDWPSDDGATAVNDDDSDDLSDSSEPGQSVEDHTIPGSRISSGSGTLSRMFDSGVSVVLNGKAWSQVVVADKGVDEAVIVVYGLQPECLYDLEMIVGSREQKKANLAARFITMRGSTSGSDSAGLPTPEAHDATLSSNPHDVPQKGNMTPRQSSESGHQFSDRRASLDSPILKKELSKADLIEAQRNALTVELRQARKEASRAEQALRNEIEGIKKNLERNSDVDHRSKQKVLALQESIRQANQSAKDLAEEAEIVESEHSDWEKKAKSAAEKEAAALREAERAEGDAAAQIKEDEDLTAVVEKELAAMQKTLTSRLGEVEKLRVGKVADLEGQIAELEAEVVKIKRTSTPPPLESMRWSRGVLEPHAPPFMPGQFIAGGSGGRGAHSSSGLRGGRQYRESKGPSMGAPAGVGIKNVPQRHLSGTTQTSKRGRGGVPGPVIAGHPHNGMPVPPGSSSYEGTGLGYPPMMPYAPQDFTVPGGYASAPATSRPAYPSGLNPATQDFTPGSGHPSPILSRRLSPMLPIPPGSSQWSQSGADFSPPVSTAGSSLNRIPFRSGEGNPLHDSPTMGSTHFLGSRRDSPTSSSAFPSSSFLGPPTAHNGYPSQPPRRSSSMGSPDDTTDLFDPTASGPPPTVLPSASPSLAQFPGRNQYDLGTSGVGPSASPWMRQVAPLPPTGVPSLNNEASPRPGSGPLWGAGPPLPAAALAGPAVGGKPILTSSPIIAGPSGPLDDIWAPAPSSSSGGSRVQHTPSLHASGSTSVYPASLHQHQQSQPGPYQLYQQQGYSTRHSSPSSGSGGASGGGSSPFVTASSLGTAMGTSTASATDTGSGTGDDSRTSSLPTSPTATTPAMSLAAGSVGKPTGGPGRSNSAVRGTFSGEKHRGGSEDAT